jgi:capsular exopolysaccharide synthesis family protein
VVSSIATSAFANLRSVILAILAGLLLSVFGAMLFQYFDRTVRDESQAASYTGLPLLAQVARVKASGNPHPLSVLTEQMFQCLEAFRLMRVNLGLDFSQGQVLLVSSPGEKEGKTTIAANLARVVALEGRRVLLIDGSLRKPGIAAAFGLAEGEGLSDFLKGEKEEPWDYITQAEEIDILTSGATSVTSAEMLASPRMKALLKSAREIYDVIIVDSAPLMGCADTRILARDVDVVLLVFQIDASKLDLAMESKQVLETMGVRVAGFVLNKVDPKECKYLPPTYTDKEPQHGVDEEEPADLDGVTT